MAKVWGVDVSKDYIIIYDGDTFYKFFLSEVSKFVSLISSGDVIVLEQTGTYSLPWIFNVLKAKTVEVYIAHTTALRKLRDLKGVSKNDALDSALLREMFLNGEAVYKFDPNRFWLRFYFFNYRRAVKDFTTLVNRTRAFLSFLAPDLAGFKTTKRRLEELKRHIERKAKRDYLWGVVYRYLDKIILALEDRKVFERELHKYLVTHRDYEILKTFPHFSDLVIAGLIATYWDINNFKPSKTKTFSGGKVKIKKVEAVDKFVSYLMGKSKRWQSGKMDRAKKETKRAYILGLFYPIYMQAGRKDSVFYPLFEYINKQYSKLSGKQRYIKFLDRLLRLVYLAIKNRWTFEEVIKHKVDVTLDGKLKEVYIQILERVRGE